MTANIEVTARYVEAEKTFTEEKAKNLKWKSWRWSYNGLHCQKNRNKVVLCNQLLEEVVNNLPIFNAGGEGNKAGGTTQVTFMNPKDESILG